MLDKEKGARSDKDQFDEGVHVATTSVGASWLTSAKWKVWDLWCPTGHQSAKLSGCATFAPLFGRGCLTRRNPFLQSCNLCRVGSTIVRPDEMGS